MRIPALFRKYIWLVNTIHRAGRITLAEINDKWMSADISEGQPLARATFNRHKAAIEEIETDFEELENKTVRLLANFDLNPAAGKPKSVALEMFETKCGGHIEPILCSWDDRYDKLSTMVLGDDSPDMFSAEDLDIFPGKVIEGKFQAMDDYVDFDSELWAPMKHVNDMFSIKGRHYIGATSTDAGVVVIYNKKTIEENGLPDPAQLLEEGNWTWDTFYDMIAKFYSRPDEKFGIDGWEFENAFAVTSGVPYVDFKDGKQKCCCRKCI